jgi:hypothetical protein
LTTLIRRRRAVAGSRSPASILGDIQPT